jgi:hypothetical protein
MESKIITKPTVVRIPANVWHCPILFRKMKKPLIFQAAFMSGTWGTINKVPDSVKLVDADGKNPRFREIGYMYNGDNVRMCKYNPRKRCNICGKCFPRMEVKED